MDYEQQLVNYPLHEKMVRDDHLNHYLKMDLD